jgi:hypothetical protein
MAGAKSLLNSQESPFAACFDFLCYPDVKLEVG